MPGILPDWLDDGEASPARGLLGDWLGNNSATLMGLGAGIAGGRTWGEGLSKGFQNAMTGRALDQRRSAHDQVVAALMQRGLDATTATAAAGNPTMLRAMLQDLGQAQPRARTSWEQRAAAPMGANGGLAMASTHPVSVPPQSNAWQTPVPPAESQDPVADAAAASWRSSALQNPAGPPSAPAFSTRAAHPPPEEAAKAEDARRAAAERLMHSMRRPGPPSPDPFEAPAPVEHLDSAGYWGAALPEGASGPPQTQGLYLSPVPKAPRWEQVVPSETPWSVSAPPPSPTSWGKANRGMECYTSGGNLHCITPGGRRVTAPAQGLSDGLRIAQDDPDYHYYDVPVDSSHRDPAKLAGDLIKVPTPALRVRPATAEGTPNSAVPPTAVIPTLGKTMFGSEDSPSWPVRSYVTRDQKERRSW
jgi:hypothetical protein